MDFSLAASLRDRKPKPDVAWDAFWFDGTLLLFGSVSSVPMPVLLIDRFS